MGLGAELLAIMRDTVKLTDSVERLNAANVKLQDKVEKINERVIVLETRLNTYVEVAQANRLTKD